MTQQGVQTDARKQVCIPTRCTSSALTGRVGCDASVNTFKLFTNWLWNGAVGILHTLPVSRSATCIRFDLLSIVVLAVLSTILIATSWFMGDVVEAGGCVVQPWHIGQSRATNYPKCVETKHIDNGPVGFRGWTLHIFIYNIHTYNICEYPGNIYSIFHPFTAIVITRSARCENPFIISAAMNEIRPASE